ncbi:hypothetical protein VPH35_047177 [Triticum aestivum]
MAAVSREERWSLAGKTALVTGGTKGIGRAIVEELAGFGVRVHTCARSDADMQERLRGWAAEAEVGRLSARVTGSACDVSVRVDWEALMATANAELGGKLDILVNNAGQTFFGEATACTAEEYTRLMATNLESCFQLAQLAHLLLLAGNGGSVVNISSIGGILGYSKLSLYSATKAALNQLTRVRTDLLDSSGIQMDSEAARRMWEAESGRTALGLLGEPEEVASLVGFLLGMAVLPMGMGTRGYPTR